MNKSEIKDKYLKKIKLLNKYNKYYYDKSNPIVLDRDYDELKKDINFRKQIFLSKFKKFTIKNSRI